MKRIKFCLSSLTTWLARKVSGTCITLLGLAVIFSLGSMLAGCDSFKQNVKGTTENVNPKAPVSIYPSPMEDPQNYPYK